MNKPKFGKSGLMDQDRSPKTFGYKQEIIGVLFGFVCVFLAVAFFSYNATDNSWFYFSSANTVIANWCGVVGANIASLFFFLFGSASYMFLLSLVLSVYLLFKTSDIKVLFLRLGFAPILPIVGSALFRIHDIDFVSANSGGIIGQYFSAVLLPIFGETGTILLLYTMLWVSVLVLAQVSFVSFASMVASVVLFVSARFVKYSYIGLRSVLSFLGLLFVWLARFVSYCFIVYVLRREYKGKLCKDKHAVESGDVLWMELEGLVGDVKHSPRVKGKFAKKAMRKKKKNAPRGFMVPDFSNFGETFKNKKDLYTFEKECRERGKKLEEKLIHFGVKGKVTAIRPGPVITLFEYKPEIDSKISKIVSLEDDLAMALTALSIRIIAPIPGKNVIGFEISNQVREDVHLSNVLKDKQFKSGHKLPLALGVDITGNPVIQDLIRMPHLLVAGSTGSGKSVGLNAMLVSLLCDLTPDQLKIVLIDPKRLEFAPYADIPHLLFPIVTSPRQAVPVLKWVVQEMEDRYEIMAKAGVRDITGYHNLLVSTKTKDESYPKMPFIVVIIDELADLMVVAGKDVEMQIARIAQMARAAGIHMIVATQRPSVDVVTGIIKVNFPARMAFRVSSKIDSRTIIDTSGAEKLLGRGDLLFLNSGSSNPERIHGAYVSSAQINKLSRFLRAQEKAQYLDLTEVLRRKKKFGADEIEDDLYDEVKDFIKTVDEISISLLQRKYRIGFNRSARLIEKLEMDGVISPPTGGKMRKVLN